MFLAPVEQKLGRKKGDAPIKNAMVAPYILPASGTASAGRVPGPPEDTSLKIRRPAQQVTACESYSVTVSPTST